MVITQAVLEITLSVQHQHSFIQGFVYCYCGVYCYYYLHCWDCQRVKSRKLLLLLSSSSLLLDYYYWRTIHLGHWSICCLSDSLCVLVVLYTLCKRRFLEHIWLLKNSPAIINAALCCHYFLLDLWLPSHPSLFSIKLYSMMTETQACRQHM